MGISVYDTKNYAQYNPLSIQEIWAPGQALRQQHDQLAEEYAQQELLGGAASLGLQEGVDKQALADNKAYMDALKQSADELSTKGFIDAGRRKNLYKLKQQYTTTVLPIQNALKVRDEAIKMDREMKARDSSYQTKFDPSKIAVTDYLSNNQAFNTRGVSGQEVYKDAAQAISNLKDVAVNELPSLKGSGLMDQYFTLQKQGLSPDQAATLMQKQSKTQAEAESWTKMAKMTVSAIDGAMQRHGVYDIFKDNPEMINKFWQDTSKAAIFGVGSPKIGQMTDTTGAAMRAAQQQQQQPDGLMDEERYDPEYDKKSIKSIDDIANKAKTPPSKSSVTGFGPYGTTRTYNEAESKNEHKKAIGEILKIGKSFPEINPPKPSSTGNVSKSEMDKYIDAVSAAQKEVFKTANKMKTISNTSKDVAGGIVSNLMSRDEFKDIDGDDVKYDSKSMANITTDFNFKKGLFLNIPSEDGKIKKIKFDISDLNTPAITDAYTAIQRIDAGVPTQKDIDLIKKSGVETYGDYKNLVAKDIRTRMSLTPGVTTVKP